VNPTSQVAALLRHTGMIGLFWRLIFQDSTVYFKNNHSLMLVKTSVGVL
jgi:hypothetical protein